jgi:hypothetical protein
MNEKWGQPPIGSDSFVADVATNGNALDVKSDIFSRPVARIKPETRPMATLIQVRVFRPAFGWKEYAP